MIRYLLLLSLLIMVVPSHSILAQQDTTSVENQLEKVFEEFDEDEIEEEGERLIQFLQDLAANPINLNTGTIDDFLQIPGVTLKLAKAIIDYREEQPFQEKSDLIKVRGIGKVSFAKMSPYVTIGGFGDQFRALYTNPDYWTQRSQFEYISRFQQTLEDQEGFNRPDTSGGFLGNPVRFYQRYRYSSQHLSINYTQEKDAGEELGGPLDFDFNSFHIAANDVGKLRRLVIGDYALSFGQGLVLWNGGAFGKGREVIKSVSRNERGVKPYSSAQETDFFRGVAATYGDKIQTTIFFSQRDLTSSIITDDTLRFPSSTGFHRTQNEFDRRNNLGQTTYGGRVRYESAIGLVGVSAFQNSFDQFIDNGTSLSSQFDFEGENHSVVGADYRLIFDRYLLFGEVARSENDAYAGIFGVEAELNSKTTAVLNYRSFQRDFQSFFGDAFGEASGDPQNEEGFYIGLRYELNTDIRLSTYFDQYEFTAPRSGINQASQGYDVLGLFEYRISRALQVYVLYRNEIKDDEFKSVDEFGREIRLLGESRRNSLRTQADYQINRKVRIRSRLELVRSRNADENPEFGFLAYQDLRVQAGPKLKFDGRVTVFDTDSFDARVFQFENDLLFVLTNTALSGQGQRAYVLANYSLTEYLTLSMKYSVTVFENAFTVSSGLNEIQGDTRSQLGIQLRLKI